MANVESGALIVAGLSVALLSRRFGSGALMLAGAASGALYLVSYAASPSLARYDDARSRAYYTEALQRVRALPGVRAAA